MFKDKIIVITGASSGLGWGVAQKLAKEGGKIINADLNPAETQHENIVFESLDVTDYQAFEEFIAKVVQQYGRIDYFFNNAGIGITGLTHELTIDQWNKVLAVNLNGVVNGTHLAYQQMHKQGFGHIINTASLAGLIPFPTSVPYGASKFAVVGLSKSLRAEASQFGVKVSAICPGFVHTNIYSNAIKANVSLEGIMKAIPLNIIQLDEAVERIYAGVVANKALITFPFTSKFIVWLEKIFPRFVNKYLLEKTTRDFTKMRELEK